MLKAGECAGAHVSSKGPQSFTVCRDGRRAFSLYESASTIKTLLIYYAKQAPKYGKKTGNWDTDAKILREGRLG